MSRSRCVACCALVVLVALVSACKPAADKVPEGQANRVIFLVGDGMGITTLTAARIHAHGEDGNLTLDTLPEVGFVRTASRNARVSDSAAAMTAYVTGEQVDNGVLSLRPGGAEPATTLIERAVKAGWATGVVTTTRVTHATPAACYAHGRDRGAEDAIAAQLVPRGAGFNAALGTGVDVIFGGGLRHFLPAGTGEGVRADGRDLLSELRAQGYTTVDSADGLRGLPSSTRRAVGLFRASDLSYALDRDDAREPSLAELATAAMAILERNPKGSFLMVEGGRIDHALHASNAARALAEVEAFDATVAAVIARARERDPALAHTLIVATADHDHTLVLNGYAKRTGPTTATQPGVLGLVHSYLNGAPDVDADGAPYTVVGFGTGERRVPGRRSSVPALTDAVASAPDYRQEAAIRMPPGQETHGGVDVPIYALGIGAERFRGFRSSTDVFALLRDARPALPKRRSGRARNVIFFLGDGMGPASVTAGRSAAHGEDGHLAMETLPSTAKLRTYSRDAQTTDSAPSMSAYMTGVKMNNEVISMSAETRAEVVGGTCRAGNGAAATTLLELAKKAGKAVGAVTTTEATHATPAATYAHVCHRELAFEIAAQAVPGGAGFNSALGDGLTVLFGGGRNHFTPFDPSANPRGRLDGRDLIAELRGAGYTVATTRAAFDALPVDGSKVVALLAANGHLAFSLDRDPAQQPSLAELTAKALDVLEKDPDGYFLMVEGGRIDHALHATNAARAVAEVASFDAAIALALGRVNLEDTLVVVTADHDHTLTINGSGARGADASILDVVKDPVTRAPVLDADGLPYPTLVFGNGVNRPDVRSANDTAAEADPDHLQLTGLRRGGETHGGGDVELMAGGAGAEAFHGTLDNTQVFGLVRSAAGL